jgi:hypothetical protein
MIRNEMSPGMVLGMGFGWIPSILILALLVLAVAALIKNLQKWVKGLHYDLHNQSND